MKVVYFGTPEFAASVLTYLLKEGVDIVAVVTKPDRPKGRSLAPVPTPVKLAAGHIPVYQPEKASDSNFAHTLSALNAELFVVVAYGEIVKNNILALPLKGCINLHASLLPKLRGAAPIQRSIIQGETETGVSIIRMAEKMDAGDILETTTVPIGTDTTYGDLEQALCEAGAKTLLHVIRRLEQDNIVGIVQDHSKATFAPKIELEECQIDWQKPALAIHNLVRGVNPHPGAWTIAEVKNKRLRLKINGTKCHPERNGKPGEILAYGKEGFLIACGQGAVELLEIQLEGKKAMGAQELMRGLPREQIHFPIAI